MSTLRARLQQASLNTAGWGFAEEIAAIIETL